MSDDQDLKSDIADRAAAVKAGVIIALVGAAGVVGLTMYYAGRFDNLTTANTDTPATTQTAQPAPASPPAAPSGTVGQAPQSPAPANTNR